MKPRFSSLVRSRRFRACGAALALFPAQAAHAGDAGQAAPASEGESRAGDQDASRDIVVYGRGLQQVGTATSGSQGVVGYADFENRPIARVGELAENVPGLIATQHSGEGKANQYFLRGFNLDHGTDLAGSSTEPRSTCGPMAMGRAISISTS
jgi:outer membrane cobalamin receptor